MNNYRADLHIHSVLSPCGDLEMSPVNIIKKALEQNLDIIGITDHNSTLHGPLLRSLGQKNGIFVLTGAEVTSKEEVHCLTFFENDEILGRFQVYLDSFMSTIQNDPALFGYQIVVDKNEQILQEIQPLLIAAINQSIEEIEVKVHQLGGIFIPAHINKPANSLLSNLGFLPPELKADAIEISNNSNKETFLKDYPEFERFTVLKNSDAHQIEYIGRHANIFSLDTINFNEIYQALHHINGRKVKNL